VTDKQIDKFSPPDCINIIDCDSTLKFGLEQYKTQYATTIIDNEDSGDDSDELHEF